MHDILAILGGIPVRAGFPRTRPRLSEAETLEAAAVLRAPEWSRVGDDWPLPVLDALEEGWARAHGVEHAIAVSSGTAALTLTLLALRVPAGDEVIVPAFGCPAVDVAVLGAGLTPIHVDIDPATYCLSPAAVAAAVTPRTAAVIAVHFAGQPAHLAAQARISDRFGLALIEDACLAPGASYDGRPVGSWGCAGAFSLGVRKPISAGEGGVVVTRDARLAAEVRRLRSLGCDPESGDILRASGNYRLSAFQAAVALPQLARLPADRTRRNAAAMKLVESLSGEPAWQPLVRDPRAGPHPWAQFWLRYDDSIHNIPRERVIDAVRAEGVPLHAGWPQPGYTLGMYAPERANEWLRARNSGRDAEHYRRSFCPFSEDAAFQGSMLLDFALIDGDERTIETTAQALRKVGKSLKWLR